MEQIINDYLDNLPLLEICRKYKIGKKKLYPLLLSNGIQLRRNKNKLDNFPYYKGQVIDAVTILDDDYYFDGERWVIRATCRCGNLILRRPKGILENNLVFVACEKCMRKNIYPEQRKKRTDCYTSEGLSFKWLKGIKNNLKRGILNIRTLECNIKDSYLYDVLISQNKKCALTGQSLNILYLTKDESNASVDRIDSTKGYIIGNIQWVTKDVNRMKNEFSQEYFINICKKVSVLHGNFEPSSQKDIKVSEKVQRLESEESNQ
jgi:hypothetical protein